MPDIVQHCKMCPGLPEFPNISQLRIHQWAVHPERYKKLKTSGRGNGLKPGTPEHEAWRKKISRSRRKQIPTTKVVSVRAYRKKAEVAVRAAVNGDMRVTELLEEFKTQRKFLDDVISLVSEIYERTR